MRISFKRQYGDRNHRRQPEHRAKFWPMPQIPDSRCLREHMSERSRGKHVSHQPALKVLRGDIRGSLQSSDLIPRVCGFVRQFLDWKFIHLRLKPGTRRVIETLDFRVET